MDQEKTIKKLKQGDKKIFRELFDSYFNPLTGFGYKYVPDHFVVEDIVQEVFLSFWQKREDFDHINAIKTFLYTSVKNKCLNHIKHLEVERKHEPSLIQKFESDHYFEERVIEEETFNQLYVEIRNLPPSAQEIMLLAMNGMKNPEIAEELNISVNTVKTQKKIAYAKLKEAIGPLAILIIIYLMNY
ncbi:RNA polymerase sigma factor [Bacteroidota bacterium]